MSVTRTCWASSSDMPVPKPSKGSPLRPAHSSLQICEPPLTRLMMRSSTRAVCQRHQAMEWLPCSGTKWSCSSLPLRASTRAACVNSRLC